MKKLLWILLFLFPALALYGQRNADYGIFAGTSSYLGDINPNRIYYSPSLAGGIFYRYNLHPRQAFRANLFYGKIKASDSDFSNSFQQTRNASFSGTVGEFSLQFEFNFMPYSTEGKPLDYTPYIAAGGGIAMSNSNSFNGKVSSNSFSIVPVIPFSVGFKINIYKNLGLEAEYGLRKTFYDNFDGLKDFIAPPDYAWLHNNDWYSFSGVAITWKFYDKLAGCPTYDDVDSKRKR
jgi:hypothetical protein